MRKSVLAFVFTAALLAAMALPLFGSGGTAFAHETSDEAADTPFASQAGLDHGLSHYLDAGGHSEAFNSLFRNPTCGAHFGEDGIHPPGNP